MRTNRNIIIREALRDKPIKVKLPKVKLDPEIVERHRKAIENFLKRTDLKRGATAKE